MENLPLEIKVQIALCHPGSYVGLLLDRDFALWTLSHQQIILKTFIREEHRNGEIHRYIGDRLLYHPDISSIESAERKLWKKNGVLHRDNDRPAEIWADDTKCWYQCGKLHRDGDQPAIILSDGTQKWCRDGKLHRDRDQPAVIYSDDTKCWFHHGTIHRDHSQPAIIREDGMQFWYVHGKFIREEKI